MVKIEPDPIVARLLAEPGAACGFYDTGRTSALWAAFPRALTREECKAVVDEMSAGLTS